MPPGRWHFMRKRYDWESIFNDFASSGLAAKQFCLERNLNYHSFMNKKKSVEKNTNCNSFLPVVISVPSDKISFSFDGHIIEVDSSINDDALCRVINALKSS